MIRPSRAAVPAASLAAFFVVMLALAPLAARAADAVDANGKPVATDTAAANLRTAQERTVGAGA